MDESEAIAILCVAANFYRWTLWAEDGYVRENQRESREIAEAIRAVGGLPTTIGEGWD